MKTRIGLVVVALLVLGITEINFGELTEFRRMYGRSLIEPVSYLALGILVTGIILLCFSQEVFNKWLQNIAVWYFPLTFLVVLSGSTGSSYAWISRGDLAALMGTVLVVITLVFAVTQRFYYKQA